MKKYLSAILITLSFANFVIAEDFSEVEKRIQLLENEIKDLKDLIKKEPENLDKKSKFGSEIDESAFRPSVKTLSLEDTSDNSQRKKELGQFGITYRSDGFVYDGLRFGAYGESIFGRQNTSGNWNNGFDANRIVLLGTYSVTPDIIFNTEIEFEHGGIAFDEDDKLGGAIEVEQMFVDFKINDNFSWRSFGVDVVPIGYVGLFHEPTQFYSSKRPELYDGLIPATWFAPSTGLYGKIIDGLNYQFQISSSLEDAGTTAEDEDGLVPEGGYEAGISGLDALGLARAPIGDRSQLNNEFAYALRVSFLPTIIPGLSGSTSFYYTNDVTPRGAYGTNANGSTRLLGKSDLSMYDFEVRYRPPTSGLELRLEYVGVEFGNTDNLRANNDNDSNNNVGNKMYGYSLESAYHVNLTSSEVEPWELVPFYRYSYIDLQNSGVQGSDLNLPTGLGTKEYNTFGVALFPTPKLVMKLDYQLVKDDDPNTNNDKFFLGSFGFFF